MQVVATAIVVAAVLISWQIARLSGWACSSDDEVPWSFEADVCDALPTSSPVMWALVILAPAIVFGCTQLVARLRAHALFISIAVSALTISVWVAIGAVVSG